jgi:hypothetical protein
MLRGPIREDGVISSGPWSKDEAFPGGDAPATTSALMRRKRRKVWGLNESSEIDLKRGKWAQSAISKRRKSLREERILNRSGQGAATAWILIGSAASEHMCLRADIYRSELGIASAKVGQNRTLKMRESDRKLGYQKETRQVSTSLEGAVAWIWKRSAASDHERWY